jgi:hypothetical protein
MSTLKVDTITSADGTASPEFANGLSASGTITINGSGSKLLNGSVSDGSITVSGGEGISGGQTSGGFVARGSADSYNAGGVEIYSGGSERFLVNSAGNATFSGDLTVSGELIVDGTTKLGFTSAPTWDTNSYLYSISGDGLHIEGFNQTFSTGSSRTNRLKIASDGDISFYDSSGTSQSLFWDASAESLGIGTSSPVASLDVVAGADDRLLVTNSSGDTLLSSVNAANTAYNGLALNGSEVKLFTNASERARINASGALKQSLDGNYLGASGSYNEFNVNTTNSYGLIVSSTNASPGSTYVQDLRFRNASPNNTSARFLACNDSTEEKAAISSNGDFTSRTNSYGGYSDIKLKENVVDASEKLTDIMQLKVRNFNFKNDPDLKQIGFIAQEFEQIFPALVTESPDRDQQGNISTETTKSIKTSVLIPILVKAMQEQQAIIESLTARIEALEGAN